MCIAWSELTARLESLTRPSFILNGPLWITSPQLKIFKIFG